MRLIIGYIAVVVCTLGGYMAMGGKLLVLWQPFEVVIIIGSAMGAYVTANSGKLIKDSLKGVGKAMKGPKYKKEHYLEMLTMQFQVYKLIKTKGVLAVEQHIENPHESSLFGEFPKFQHDHHAVEFFCDYLRMISLGSDTPHVMDDLMTQELEIHHEEHHQVSSAVQTMADGMPALGIVAAVLGVIKTMGSITEPPEVLGKLIGGALVGTFLGVWVAYGFVAPLATSIGSTYDHEGHYMLALKSGLLAQLQGSPPAVAVEFARKSLPSDVRPTFAELEARIDELPPVK